MNQEKELRELLNVYKSKSKKRGKSKQKEITSEQEKVENEQKYRTEPLIVRQMLIRKPLEVKLKEPNKTLPSTRSENITLKIPKTILLTLPSVELKRLKKEFPSKKKEIITLIIEPIKLDKAELKLKTFDTSVETLKSEESSSESEKHELLEEIDFIEFLLGKGSGKILSGKPLCIIVERHPDKYEYIVVTICREVYREKKGGYPQPIPVKTVDEIEFEFKADISDQIIIVENAKYSEILRKAVSKFPFSSLGFLILVTDKPEELEMEIRKNIPKAEEFILRIEPVKIDEKLKIGIIEFISGSQLLKSYSFGEDFLKATQVFNDQLKKYLDFSKAPKELRVMWHKLMAKSPEISEQASEEHSAMKSFVWQHLYRKYKKIPKLEDERSVDVSIDNENYEIETFYGCGDSIAKLTEKMEKFTRSDKIFFVLRNISILMHLKELISFKKTWKDLGYDVEILGIDFKRKDLISLNVLHIADQQK